MIFLLKCSNAQLYTIQFLQKWDGGEPSCDLEDCRLMERAWVSGDLMKSPHQNPGLPASDFECEKKKINLNFGGCLFCIF